MPDSEKTADADSELDAIAASVSHVIESHEELFAHKTKWNSVGKIRLLWMFLPTVLANLQRSQTSGLNLLLASQLFSPRNRKGLKQLLEHLDKLVPRSIDTDERRKLIAVASMDAMDLSFAFEAVWIGGPAAIAFAENRTPPIDSTVLATVIGTNRFRPTIPQVEAAIPFVDRIHLLCELDESTSRANTQPSSNAAKLKEPSANAKAAYRVWLVKGFKQKPLAEYLTEELKRPVSQGQVSKLLKTARLWLEAGNVFDGLPGMTRKPATIDPERLELGPRQDRHTPRQRQHRSDDAED